MTSAAARTLGRFWFLAITAKALYLGRSVRQILSFFVSALALLACSKRTPMVQEIPPSPSAAASVPSPSAVLSAAPKPPPTYNVILIMIDSLRADMPWAGYGRDIAPWLTGFEKRTTSFTRAYSLSSYTAKSVAPALVGKYPSEMERDGYFFTQWLPENLFVSERAQAAGVRTLAGHGHGYFLRKLGLDQGFDDYRLLPGTFLDLTGVSNVTGEPLTELAKTMLSDPKIVGREGRRFFAYFHFLDPHYTYYKHKDHPDYGDKRRDLYDSEVHYTDHWVGKLVDWALARPWGSETAVIITADHGEGFGEHGHFRHAYELWETLVRVPWFIYVPGAAPHRVDVPRGHIDLAPTIAELLGLPQKPPFRGKSLAPEVRGAPAEPRPVIVDLPRCDIMDRRRGMIWQGYKLLSFGDDRRFMLFDLERDPNEDHDLANENPERLESMKKKYAEVSEQIPIVPVTGGVPLKGAPESQRW